MTISSQIKKKANKNPTKDGQERVETVDALRVVAREEERHQDSHHLFLHSLTKTGPI